MEILRVEDLTKIYGKGETAVTALDHVSFTVEKGEFVAIIGPSGSGKSTLLHMLGGVDTPTSGKVYIDGTDIYSLNESKLAIFRRRQIGLIYQFYNLIPVLNVEENITLPLLLDDRRVKKEDLHELIAILGVGDRLEHLPNQLSGGQQQRVSIGRALVNNPAIVLADEPTGNLDSVTSLEIMNIFQSLHRENTTIVLVTHEADIAAFARKILHFRDGKLIKDELLNSLLTGPSTAKVGEDI